MKRSWSVLLSLALLLTALFTGCNNSQEISGSQTASTAEGDVPSGITLTIGMPAAWQDWGNISELMQQWADETGNKIDIQAGEDSEFIQQLTAKLMTGGCWDVVLTGGGESAKKYNPSKNFADLSDRPWVEYVSDAMIPILTFDGVFCAAPFSGSSAMGIVYNKTVFEKYGLEVPKTVDQLNAVCETLKSNGVIPFYMSGADGWTISQTWNAIWPNIARDNPDAMNQLNSNSLRWDEIPELKQYFELWADQVSKGYFNDDMATASYAMAVESLASGECAMVYQGTWMYEELAKLSEQYPDSEYGIFAAPAFSGEPLLSTAASYAMYVYNDSPNRAAAIDLIDYLCSQSVLQNFYDTKGDLSVWKNVEAKELNPLNKDAQTYVANGTAGTHWADVYKVPYNNDLNQTMFQAFLGTKNVEDTLSDVADFWQKAGNQAQIEGF